MLYSISNGRLAVLFFLFAPVLFDRVLGLVGRQF